MGEIADFITLYIKDMDTLEKETNNLSQSLENNIKKEAPYKEGRLRRSIEVISEVYDDHAVIVGTFDEGEAPHGIFVLSGTRPHDIYVEPKNKKALYWGASNHGKPIMSKGHTIHHPGTAPDDFLRRGLDATLEAYR